MVAVFYLFVAAVSLVLAWRAAASDPRDPARRDFALLALLIGVADLAFSLLLFPGVAAMRWVWAIAGAGLPVATLQFLDRFFRPPGQPPSDLVQRFWVLTPLAVAAALVAEWVVDGRLTSDVTAAKMGLGAVVYLGLVITVRELWTRYESSPFRVERSRITYLLTLMTCAIGFSSLEGLVRIYGWPPNVSGLDPISRSAELQGLIPPFGALFTGLFVYCLYLIISLDRLLDLEELFARLSAVVLLAALLVGVDFAAVVWLDTITENPQHTAFQVFVASVLFLLAYDPLRVRVQELTAQAFNRRGRQLNMALDELAAALPRVISLQGLAQVVLGRLHASGRFPALALYVYDPDRRQVRRIAQVAAQGRRLQGRRCRRWRSPPSPKASSRASGSTSGRSCSTAASTPPRASR